MKRFLTLCIALFSLAQVDAQEVKARIAGLETDSVYMSLLEEDRAMQLLLDSLNSEITSTRQLFRDNPQSRAEYGEKIVLLEHEIFSVRSRKGQIIDRINSIEQEWILKAMSTDTPITPTHSVEEPLYADSPKSRNLVSNACFEKELLSVDYSTLLKAQDEERVVAREIERYADNYALMLEMQQQYQTVTEQGAADSLYLKLETLAIENDSLDNAIAERWSYIFDNKSFSYSYLLDKTNRMDILEQQTEKLAAARRSSDELRGEYASDALVGYFIQKQALVNMEIKVAEEFELQLAKDSLQRELEYLKSVDFRLPRVVTQRRYLLDYESIEFFSPSKYNTKNPIPETVIYEHGTIYRIRLGSYKYKQQVSIFRGVYPLSINREEGRFVYYTGGFATKVEARLACELLRQKGFRQPTIVCWRDGVSEIVDENAPEVSFRVEISGANTLSDEIKAVIRGITPDKELSKIGAMFIVGMFDERAIAEELASAIRTTDGTLDVKITESTK
ncbi:MAG: SPOR domain-containing protein [Alistipes sp.]|nr:SPOR domain-containing protein [Alistipes sp.]